MTDGNSNPLRAAPESLRTAIIYDPLKAGHETLARQLMLMIGAGRFFATGDFRASDQENYNLAVIVTDTGAGSPDPVMLEFCRKWRAWLGGCRVILLAVTGDGQSGTSSLEPLQSLLGSAVVRSLSLVLDPAEPCMASIVDAGDSLRQVKEDFAIRLAARETREMIETFLKRRKHCVLATGSERGVRATSVSYFYHDGHVYVLSEGSGKFSHILLNDQVCVAMFAPPSANSKVAGVQLTGQVQIWHPETEEYRQIITLKGSDYERLRSLPFILWALDIRVRRAEYWWGDLRARGFSPRQRYDFMGDDGG